MSALNWVAKFRPSFASAINHKLIAQGLMMYETDDAAKPIPFRFSTGEGKAQYSLTRSEAAYLAAQLNNFLEKGQDT